jgi:hypothetical protein
MGAYTGRSRQGENMLRTIHFDHPEWTPVLVGFLPACFAKYGERLDDLRRAHPRLFPNFDQASEVQVQDLYVSGKTTDCWRCVWDNLHEGMVGQVVGHPLADWAEFEVWVQHKPDPIKDGLLGPRDWNVLAQEIARKKELGHFSPDHILAHGFHYMLLCDLRGFENIMLDMAVDEPMLHNLIDVLMEYNAASVRKLLETGTEFLGLAEDLGMQHALPISLELWRKFVKPGYECTAGQARDRGLPVFLHSDGHILPIVGDLIETGIRVLNPQIRANSLQGLQATAKGKMTICIDLDRQLFPFATPDEAREHVGAIHAGLSMPEGGLILNIEIGEDVSIDVMDAIFDEVETVCKLPDPETTGRVSIGF